MRKILSLVLVLSLVLGSAGMAFAAPSSISADVEDKNVKKAVERLVAFGIVNGKDDGKYHPEDDVTREEFAKILVTALGMESAAGAVSSTSFTDVGADRWSAGYVEVAAGQGLIKGYPNGTFQPTKGVSYAEAVTMLVRALGYQDSFVKGAWPQNYIAKAADEGITSKVKFVKGTIADRGSVAVMVNNTLDAEVIKVKEYGGDNPPTFEETDVTLLEDKLEIFELENMRFLENAKLNKGLDKDEVVVIFTEDTDYRGDKDVYDESKEDDKNEYTFDTIDTFDSNYFLGLETKAYLNDDDEIVYAEEVSSGNTVYRNDRLDRKYTDDKPNKEITLVTSDADLEVPDNASIYVDGKEVDDDDFEDYLDGDNGDIVFGTWIADNDELVYANLVTWEEKDYLVQEVQADKDTLVYLDTANANDDKKKDFDDDYDNYEAYLVDGAELIKIEMSDIKEGDVFNIAEVEEDGDDVGVIYVWRNVVEGKFGDVTGGNSGQRMKVEIGDEKISVESKYTFSDDDGDDFTDANGKADRDKLEDFHDEQVRVHKNWKGRLVYITGDVNATSDDLYGVVLDYGSGIDNKVRLYTKDDEEETYEFEESDDFDWFSKSDNAPVGSIIKYELTTDNEIADYDVDKDSEYEDFVFKTTDISIIKKGDDFGKKSVEIENKNYYVTDDTIFFDYTQDNHDEDEVEVFKWADIQDGDVKEDVKVIFGKDGSDLEFLAIWTGLDDIRDDVMAGYVIDTFSRSGDPWAKVAVYDEDEVKEYELKGSTEKKLIDGRVVLFETVSGGKLDMVNVDEEDDWELVAGMVEKVDDDQLTINGEEYRVDEDAVVYEEDDEREYSDIGDDDFVVLALEKGEAKAVELVYSKTGSDEVETDAKVINVGSKVRIVLDGDKDDDYKDFADENEDILKSDGYFYDYKEDMDDIGDEFEGKTVDFIHNEDDEEILVIWTETDVVDTAVEEVEEAISDLPAADDITLDDKDDVEAARAKFEALTDDQEEEVNEDLKDKLEACEAKITELENQAAADEVEDKIADLPAVDELTLDDEDDVKAARDAYEALDDKELVDDASVEALEAAEAKIEELKNQGNDKITNAKAKNAVLFTTVTGDYADDVDKVEVIFGSTTKEATLEDGTFSYNIAPMLSAGDEVIVKGYVGDELVDTDEITVVE